MSDIFEMVGEDPEDRWIEFEDLPADTVWPPQNHDPEQYNDEGCTPGGWAKSPTC